MISFEFSSDRYPACPGCYIMRDKVGDVIYVGKSKNLRHRLTSYFGTNHHHHKVARIRACVYDIEVILVNTETESLLLENNLIKLYKPRFNSMYKPDNTGYYYIVQTDEIYPRFLPYRKNRISKQLERLTGIPLVRRFGPYVNKEYRDILLEYVCATYQLRTCDKLPTRACLHAQLGICSAACEGQISPQRYQETVEQAAEFLSGPQPDRVEKMRLKMEDLAANLLFENAQQVKRQMDALQTTLEPQYIERDFSFDQDVCFFGKTKVLIAHIHQGMILSLDLYPFPQSDTNGYCQFVLDHYTDSSPDELLINHPVELSMLQHLLDAANHKKVRIRFAGDQYSDGLFKLCDLNYRFRVPEDFS